MLATILSKVEGTGKVMKEMKFDFLALNQTMISHSASIKQLETQMSNISSHLNPRQKDGFPSHMVVNMKNDIYTPFNPRSNDVQYIGDS